MEKTKDIESNNQEKPRAWSVFWSGVESKCLGRLLLFVREKFVMNRMANLAIIYSRKGNILEAGSGSALSSILLSRKRGDRIVALDISHVALEFAENLATTMGEAIWRCEGDIEHIPFKDDSFELAWNVGTIEHFPLPYNIVREMKRVAHVTICIVPAKGFGWPLSLRIAKLLGVYVEDYIRYYDTKELKDVFEEVGFEKIKIGKISYLPFLPLLFGVGQ